MVSLTAMLKAARSPSDFLFAKKGKIKGIYDEKRAVI